MDKSKEFSAAEHQQSHVQHGAGVGRRGFIRSAGVGISGVAAGVTGSAIFGAPVVSRARTPESAGMNGLGMETETGAALSCWASYGGDDKLGRPVISAPYPMDLLRKVWVAPMWIGDSNVTWMHFGSRTG